MPHSHCRPASKPDSRNATVQGSEDNNTRHFNTAAHQIADFVKSDSALYSYYLLRSGDEAKLDTIESYCLFLLWFLLYGRLHYKYPLVIPQTVRDALALPNANGRHLLMDISLAAMNGYAISDADALARYYLQALPQFRLGPFISRAELASIARLSSLSDLAGASNDGVVDRGSILGSQDVLGQLGRLFIAKPTIGLPAVSIVGFHRSVLGIGEDARCLFDCLLDAGLRPELIDVSPSMLETDKSASAYKAFEASHPHGSVVIFCMPVFEMIRVICASGLTRPQGGQYWIGCWPWETTALPSGWLTAFKFVDEIWALSKFLHQTYSRQTDKAVYYVPPCVQVPIPTEPVEIHGVLRSSFTFLCVFDFNSRIERKNPIGAISAFRAAFYKGTEDVQMLIKTVHADQHPNDLRTVRDAIAEDARIVLIDGSLRREEVCWLIAKSQAYVSLHRSEGFGRPLAEAMLLGTTVVGTGWSGCTDFLNDETGFPIRYHLRPVGHSEYPFAAGEWAEPDIKHAAGVMRWLYVNGGSGPGMLAKAKETIIELYSRATISAQLQRRLGAIG